MTMLRVIVIVMVKVIALGLSPGHWSATRVSNNLVLKNLVLVLENLVSGKIAEYQNGKLFLGLVSRILNIETISHILKNWKI